ncbi:hypothetical protein CLAIMM_15108 [Cladophialophora immunda]|nr:hypothetical protein CLAIMM_15108 [Cladophialophora immunda]
MSSYTWDADLSASLHPDHLPQGSHDCRRFFYVDIASVFIGLYRSSRNLPTVPPCGHILYFSNSNHAYLWVTDVQIGNSQLHPSGESATNTLRRGNGRYRAIRAVVKRGEKSDDVYDGGFEYGHGI